MQDRSEVTVYDNYQLKDQWEKRAQQFNDTEKQEQARREKSALNGLFRKWQVDLAVRHGVSVSEKKGKGGDLSDFRKYVVKVDGEEDIDMSSYEAKIRVAPPPRKLPPPPPSPPPKKKPPPPPQPRKERPPKPVEQKKPEPPKKPALKKVEKPKVEPLKLPKIQPIKEPVKDSFSGAGWGESWKMLKSPRRQQRSVETQQESKQESVAPKQTNDKMYKALGYDFEKQWGSPPESWTGSWKQLKNISEEASTEDMSFFEIISQGKWWRTFEEIETFALPVWAGTWKIINFVHGQTKEAWDQEWPQYKRQPSDKGLKAQTLENKLDLPGWEESWKSSKPDLRQEKENVMTELKIPNVFLPGWNDSWKTSDMRVQHSEQSLPSMKDWRDSWSYCQEHKWCSASMESRYRHYVMMKSKRKLSNDLRGSLLDEEVPSEWMESWKSAKAQPRSEESNEPEPVSDVDKSDVPLHLQFHKINTPVSTWGESWKVARVQVAGGGEQLSSSTEWKDSWKLSNPNPSADDQVHGDVTRFPTEHKTCRYMGVKHAEDAMPQNEWSESWKTTKPSTQPEQEQGEESVSDRKYDFSKRLSPVVSVLDWTESWMFAAASRPSSSYSLARWTESWRLSNPNQPEQIDQGPVSHSYRQDGPRHHRYLQDVELPKAEWTNSWKYLKSDTLDPNMTREDSEEWGQCWRVLNPQLYMKKEAWCDQLSTEDSKDLRLQLTFLSKEDKKIVNLELSSSEWNESWRLQKQEH